MLSGCALRVPHHPGGPTVGKVPPLQRLLSLLLQVLDSLGEAEKEVEDAQRGQQVDQRVQYVPIKVPEVHVNVGVLYQKLKI